MSITHSRLSRLELKVGLTATKLFVFSAPCTFGGEVRFDDDIFRRLVGREQLREDMIVVLKKWFDPIDPNSKDAMVFGSPVSEIVLMSAAELRDENGR